MSAENSLDNDPNFIAYEEALKKGEFDSMDPASWLAFVAGKLVLTAATREQLLEGLSSGELETEEGAFVTQVKRDEEVLRGFFIGQDGQLHRGVPTWVESDGGEKTPVFLEFGTGKVFPRSEPEE